LGISFALYSDEKGELSTDGIINDDESSSTGFADFLLYSAAAVYSAYFYFLKEISIRY
jgi:hypothetical protein